MPPNKTKITEHAREILCGAIHLVILIGKEVRATAELASALEHGL